MKRILLVCALMAVATTAFAADSVKVVVGHMCCGACQASAKEGVTKLDWVQNVTIDGTTLTITPKADQKVDFVGLMDSLNKAGFPANEMMVSGPVTLSVAHLCCGGCVDDLKSKLGALPANVLDHDNIKIDQSAKTVTVQPAAGQTMNLVVVLSGMEKAGFAANKGVMTTAAAKASPKPAPQPHP